MPYTQIKFNVFDCNVCETRCDGKTVAQFNFDNDVRFSENIENEVIKRINSQYEHLKASKTVQAGYPDIEVKNNQGITVFFIEIKGQARTFMSIQKILPNSLLLPSETLACNLSDLERYFVVKEKEKVPLFLTWCLMRRPCIVGVNPKNAKFFSQEIDVLKKIRLNDVNDTRKFRRASGFGDVVNGQHKGVVVNYHFSINEFKEGLPDLITVL
jgi:hypothetical protein